MIGKKGMVWNYRIVRYTGSGHFGLHEVYYDKPDGEAVAYTERAVGFSCDRDEGPQAIIAGLEMALADARNRPVLNEEDIANDSSRVGLTEGSQLGSKLFGAKP